MNDRTLVPILVTGTHRSGTTWVGKMLAADACTAYISEPLNVLHRPGVYSARVKYWYQYICEENEREYLPAFHELLEFDYHFWDEIRSLRSRKDVLRMGRDFYIFYNGLMRGQRILLKDPFAVFSTPWFANRLGCKVVIAVRHPAAFASSLKRLNWPFDFQDLLNQPLLMRDHLEPFREEMQAMRPDDVIGQAALLWRLIYRAVHATCQSHPDFITVRHEDLSRDPISGYRNLYASLGLEFSPRVEKAILNSSSSENPMELSRKKVHGFKLDSRANMDIWKKRLAVEEIDRIHEITKDVASLYYSESEW
ncbi:MAG TPA: sulfotransferase [Anaerolineales bacterium]|nr:sulfotransferase [Anaerolineales bacterium]